MGQNVMEMYIEIGFVIKLVLTHNLLNTYKTNRTYC